jgi:hypothetical protein
MHVADVLAHGKATVGLVCDGVCVFSVTVCLCGMWRRSCAVGK